MQAKIAWAVAAAWLVLFVTSFLVLQLTEPTGDGSTRGLNRIVSFMTWQGAAFALAIAGALFTYRFGSAGKHGKLVGYVPLACSVFLIGMLVAIIAFRVLVQPQFT
jgi:hypothetical protein